ncbi:MAG: hypothetical protein F6K56_24905 [Moorea sp. SIO3G5]|nr:hypothetical protein [Moorena sp. SIO3G5]
MDNDFLTLINDLEDELDGNPNIILESFKTPLPLSKREQEVVQGVTPSSIFEFHQNLNGLNIEWEINKKQSSDVKDIKGSVKILSLKEIIQDWKGVVYFDFTPESGRIRSFHPIDFFVDEACVGAFLNEKDRQELSLYLYSFEGEPVNLNLNIEGYIQMMVLSKGFLYWQYSIIEILLDKENPVSHRFKEWMPELFPDFSWEKYIQKYNQLRIQT